MRGSSQQSNAGAPSPPTPSYTSSTPTSHSRFSSRPRLRATRDTAPSAPTSSFVRTRQRRPPRSSHTTLPSASGHALAMRVDPHHSTPAAVHSPSSHPYSAPMRPTRNSSCRLSRTCARPAGDRSTIRRTGGPRHSSGSAKSVSVRRTKMPVVCTARSGVGLTSTSSTRCPRWAMRRAATRPASPAPMIVQSVSCMGLRDRLHKSLCNTE